MTTTPDMPDSSAKKLLNIPFTVSLMPQVRFHVGECATDCGLPRECREAFVLAVHEVASHAVLHGGGQGLLHLYERHGALHCQVSAEGQGFAEAVGAYGMCGTETGDSRRGLWAVQRLAGRLKVTSGTTATVVTLTVTLPAD